MVRNTMKLVNKAEGKISDGYDMHTKNMLDIYNASNGDRCRMIFNAFRFGYMQGMKAAKAEMRKAVKA